MTGKEKCDVLKRIRAQIAAENDIPGFEYKPCDFAGECNGVCPACDLEVANLNIELRKIGKNVPLAVPTHHTEFSQDVADKIEQMKTHQPNDHDNEDIDAGLAVFCPQRSNSIRHVGIGQEGLKMLSNFDINGTKGVAYVIDTKKSFMRRIDVNIGKPRKVKVRKKDVPKVVERGLITPDMLYYDIDPFSDDVMFIFDEFV